MLEQSKPATDEYAVMIDARDALEITPGRAGRRMGRLRRQLEGQNEARDAAQRLARRPAGRRRVAT